MGDYKAKGDAETVQASVMEVEGSAEFTRTYTINYKIGDYVVSHSDGTKAVYSPAAFSRRFEEV